MIVKVLGAGAGGGLPQWNCACPQCAAARRGEIAPMTQSSVAVSADGADWIIVNASPDLRAQIAATPALHPRALRNSPIRAVVLTNADVDHIAGLLSLREKAPLTLWGTEPVLAALRENPVFGVLDPALVRIEMLLSGRTVTVCGIDIEAFAVPGKVPLYAETPGQTPRTDALDGRTVGLRFTHQGRSIAYVPGCADLPDGLCDRLGRADAVLFDGTAWAEDDMERSGTGTKTAARMGHLPMSGPHGSLARLAGAQGRKVFVHVNNTNPALLPGPEATAVAQAGWEIAFDGMEIAL